MSGWSRPRIGGSPRTAAHQRVAAMHHISVHPKINLREVRLHECAVKPRTVSDRLPVIAHSPLQAADEGFRGVDLPGRYST